MKIDQATVAQSWRWIVEIVPQPPWLKLSWIIFESHRPRDCNGLRNRCEWSKFTSHITVMKDEAWVFPTATKVYLMPRESLKSHPWTLACVQGLWLLVLYLTEISIILTFTCATWILFTFSPHIKKLLSNINLEWIEKLQKLLHFSLCQWCCLFFFFNFSGSS